jgi:ATP-dependent helicase HrpB
VKGKPDSLFEMAVDLVEGRGNWPLEVRETFQRLSRYIKDDVSRLKKRRNKPLEEVLSKIWLKVYPWGLGAHTGQAANYRFADGRAASLSGPSANLPSMILAADLQEIGGGAKGRKRMIRLWLRIEQSWIEETFPGELQRESLCGWDPKRSAVTAEETLMFRGLVLESRGAETTPDPSLAESLLVEKLMTGELSLKQVDKGFIQLCSRLRLLAQTYPEYEFPLLEQEDWKLIYHEFCSGQTSLAGLEKKSLKKIVKEYAGDMAVKMLEKALPESMVLKSGKKGKYTYFPEAPPELSARLGDFIGMEGEHTLCESRVKVLYNILAPNYRPVQKTHDLTSFWQNTYPEVKKEMKRRYPRHPWP